LLSVLVAVVGCAAAPDKPEAAAAAQAVQTDPVADEARARAAEALAKGESDVALRLYVEMADRDPTDADSLYAIGVIYDQRADHALAARAYARAVQVDPRHSRALEALGLRYFADRQHDPARDLLTRAVAADATLWRSHNALGLIADALGEHQTAVAHFTTALGVQPASATILNNRGYSRYLAGDLDVAERDFRAALTMDPDYERAWRNLGLVFARRGDYTAALTTLARVASQHVAANDVGYIAMLSGDYATAERLFAEAIRLSPRYYETAAENVADLRRRRATTARN
jgi:Flp pilus assembly protein TadD